MEFADLIKTPKVDDVILNRPLNEPKHVCLCITSHHLILSTRSSDDNDSELWILHVMIDALERKQSSTTNCLTIKCKNFLVIQLIFKKVEDFLGVAESIEWLSNIEDVRLHYPFFYQPMFEIIEDGWQTFPIEQEYKRFLELSDDWRISNANQNFDLCPSYPQIVLVPKSISDDSLTKIAQFRCLGRFPVLSYIHKLNRAVIVRSGQPLVGPGNKRNKDDENLLKTIVGSKKGYIIDTRSQNIAQLAKTKGGGHEQEAHYPLLKRVHRPIDRFNLLIDHLHKLIDACQDKNSTTEKWLSRLENSNWLRHVKDILTCACLVSQCIDQEGASVLVHGAEGMDSTLQVCSLSQIILDPDCRTVQGFEALIEREWLQAGHPFSARCKHGAYTPASPNIASTEKREFSPVFLLFLDCVYQIYQQFPCSFEFNEDFLIMLLDHSYASQFGTFLARNAKERLECKVAERTTSLWSFINRPAELEKYLNPVYEPNDQTIWPSVAPQSLELWESVYLRWVCDLEERRQVSCALHLIKDKQLEMRSEIDTLQAKLSDCQKLESNN